LLIYVYLYKENIDFKLCTHMIKYNYNNKIKHYLPDIIIGNSIYEIKPTPLLTIKINK